MEVHTKITKIDIDLQNEFSTNRKYFLPIENILLKKSSFLSPPKCFRPKHYLFKDFLDFLEFFVFGWKWQNIELFANCLQFYHFFSKSVFSNVFSKWTFVDQLGGLDGNGM